MVMPVKGKHMSRLKVAIFRTMLVLGTLVSLASALGAGGGDWYAGP
jgi:hypothetical protein